MDTGLLVVLIIIAMLAVNSVFAAYEIALASLSINRIRSLADSNIKGAHAALLMKSRMEASLAVVQIGITLAGAIAAATGGAGAEERVSPFLRGMFDLSESVSDFLSIVIVVVPLTGITIIFGELVPKTLALRYSERVCLGLSPLMRFFSLIVYPTVIFFEWITKLIVRIFEKRNKNQDQEDRPGLSELMALAKSLRIGRVINFDQEKIIIGASNLSHRTISEVMIPAYDIVMLSMDDDLPEHLIKIHTDPYTRFPVTRKKGDPRSIIGYINIKELIFLAKTNPANPKIGEILRPLVSLDASRTIGEAFSVMMREHVHLALVRNADGAVVGMITLEDILEEVVGDIQDEFDRLPRHITQIGKNYIVGGAVAISALLEKMQLDREYDVMPGATVSDWIKKHHGEKLVGGEIITVGRLRVVIRKVKLNHVFEAMVQLQ